MRSLIKRSLPVVVSGALVGCQAPCDPTGATCTVLGTGQPGQVFSETDPLASPLYGPMDVAVRPGTDEFYVADWNNHQIKAVRGGQVEVVIGTVFLGDGDPDFQERIAPGVAGTTVALNHPTQLEWDGTRDKLVIPSWHNHRIREWDPATGLSLVIAADTDIDDGNGANAGFAGDGGPAALALMAFPNSIAIDEASGDFWVLPQRNGRIRKVRADLSLIETIAGTGESGYAGDGGLAVDATFHFWPLDDLQPEPSGALEFDGEDKLYVADTSNHVIRVIDIEAGTIDTLPNLGQQDLPGGQCSADALCFPRDVELDADGQLWIADSGNSVVRRYDLASETLTTVVGTFEAGDGPDGLPPEQTMLQRPYGLDVGDDGALYIADTYNHRVRKVVP